MQLKHFSKQTNNLNILKFACLNCRVRILVWHTVHRFAQTAGVLNVRRQGIFIISLPFQHNPDILSLVPAVLRNAKNTGYILLPSSI